MYETQDLINSFDDIDTLTFRLLLCFAYGLPDCLLNQLTKVLYAAVRFNFSFKFSQRCCHMLPFLKSLHKLFCISISKLNLKLPF